MCTYMYVYVYLYPDQSRQHETNTRAVQSGTDRRGEERDEAYFYFVVVSTFLPTLLNPRGLIHPHS